MGVSSTSPCPPIAYNGKEKLISSLICEAWQARCECAMPPNVDTTSWVISLAYVVGVVEAVRSRYCLFLSISAYIRVFLDAGRIFSVFTTGNVDDNTRTHHDHLRSLMIFQTTSQERTQNKHCCVYPKCRCTVRSRRCLFRC